MSTPQGYGYLFAVCNLCENSGNLKDLAMRIIAVLAISAMLISPAAANWQNTEWGMSLDELLEIDGVEATEPFENPASGLKSLARADYRAGFIDTEAYFVFNDDGLSSVQLIVPSDHASETLSSLEDAYGPAPISNTQRVTTCEITEKTWRDRDGGNTVDYYSWLCSNLDEGIVWVTYSALPEAGSGGF